MFTSVHGTSDRSTYALRALIDMAIQQGARSLMVLSAAANQDLDDLDALARSLSVPVFGGVFPGLVEGTSLRTTGYVVVGLRSHATAAVAPALSAVEPPSVQAALARLGDAGSGSGTAFVYLNGLSRRIDGALDAVYDVCGANWSYVGAGAGSLRDAFMPSVLSNDGLSADALVLALVPDAAAVSVGHGWRPSRGPFTATAATATTLLELDFESASSVYAGALGVTPERLSSDRRLLDTHPLGIVTVTGEVIVRDVIDVVDGALVCVGEVPAQSRLHVLSGGVDSLIAGAAEVAAGLPAGSGPVMLFDCVSRSTVLTDALSTQYGTMRERLAPRVMAGAQTIGELASAPGRPPAFLNKTLVLAGGRAAP